MQSAKCLRNFYLRFERFGDPRVHPNACGILSVAESSEFQQNRPLAKRMLFNESSSQWCTRLKPPGGETWGLVVGGLPIEASPKYFGNTGYRFEQGHPSRGRNEAEIFIIAIFGWKIIFSHFKGGKKSCGSDLWGKEMLVHERLGCGFMGKCTYLEKKKGGNVIFLFRNF